MQIGMLADTYKPHISGITVWIDTMQAAMQRAGHTVTLFTFGQPLPDDPPWVVRSPALPIGRTNYFLAWGYSRQAAQALARQEILHVHHPFVSGRLAAQARRPKQALIFTNHTRYDLYLRTYLPWIPYPLGEAYIGWALRRFARHVDVLLAPSSSAAGMLARLGVRSSVQILPNAIDVARFASAQPPAQGRTSLGWSANDVVFVYTGRLAPEKDLPVCLKAFAGVLQAAPQARLLIIGDGPSRAASQRQAVDLGLGRAIHFTGKLSYAELPAWLALADGFVSASQSEVHPLSLLEAQAAGLPAVGVDAGGIGEVLAGEQTGLLTTPGDLAAFRANWLRLVQDADLRQRFAMAARQSVARLDADALAVQLAGLYCQAIERRKGAV